MTLSKRLLVLMGRRALMCNVKYIQRRALHDANGCDLQALRSTPEDFLLNLTPQSVSSFIAEQGDDPELAYRLFSLAHQQVGFKHTEAAYQAIIQTLCRAKHLDLLEKMLRHVKVESRNVRASVFDFMLKEMSKAGMLGGALRLINQRADCGWCKPSRGTYKCFLESLIQAGNIDQAMHLFVQMKEENVYPDSILVGMLTNCLCKANKLNEALKLVEGLVEVRGSVDITTLNGVIGYICRAGRPSAAYGLLKTAKACKVAPDVITYNKVMDGYCTMGKPEEAVALLDKMKEDSLEPSVVTLNTLLNGLCMQSKIDEALLLLEEMGSSVAADFMTWNIIVSALYRKKRFLEAHTLVAEMVRKGVTPTVHMYTAIMIGLFRVGKVEGACELLGEMKKFGVVPDSVIYAELVSGLCKADRVDDVLHILTQMSKDGCQRTTYLHAPIIHSLCKADRIAEAMDYGQGVIKSNGNMNMICWNPILEGLCRSGKTDEALQLLDEVIDQGCVPIRSTFNGMIKGLCLAEKLDDVRNFLIEMKKSGFEADKMTYTALINGHAHRVSGTVDLFKPLIGSNILLDIRRYNALIDGLFQTGEVEFGLKVFDEMQRVGCKPDTQTFNSLVNGLCKTDRMHEAMKFFRKMQDYGCVPDMVTYTALMHGHSTVGDYDAVDLVYREMQAQGCQPDVVTYSVLLNVYSSLGKFNELYGLLDDMKVRGCPPNETALKLLFRNLSCKDIKRARKYIKDAFGLDYTPEVPKLEVHSTAEGGSPDLKSSRRRTRGLKLQEEGSTRQEPVAEKPCMNMLRENTSRASEGLHQCAQGLTKVMKGERQNGRAIPSFGRDGSKDATSASWHSGRASDRKGLTKGKTEVQSKKTVRGRRLEGTQSSSARKGSAEVSEVGKKKEGLQFRKRIVCKGGEEDAKRSGHSSRVNVSIDVKTHVEPRGMGSSAKAAGSIKISRKKKACEV